jgi:hypothetical protein
MEEYILFVFLLFGVNAPENKQADRLDPAPMVSELRKLISNSREAWIEAKRKPADKIENGIRAGYWKKHEEANLKIYSMIGWDSRVEKYTKTHWGWTFLQASNLVEAVLK